MVFQNTKPKHIKIETYSHWQGVALCTLHLVALQPYCTNAFVFDKILLLGNNRKRGHDFCTKNFWEKWPKDPHILRGKKVEILIVRPGSCSWLVYNWVSEDFYFSLLHVAKFG